MKRRRNGRRVLVVEDDAQLLELAKVVLDESGYASVPAATGAAALDALERDAGGLYAVLLDLGLHDMPGGAVLVRAKQIRPDLPVIVATGSAERPSDARVVIRKPYGPDELVHALDALTEPRPTSAERS
jgi:CheY-like chemotaxis protein